MIRMATAVFFAAVSLNSSSAVAAEVLTFRQVEISQRPTASTASRIAAAMVKIVRGIDGIPLDYSIASLQYVDVKIDEFRVVGYSAEDVDGALLGLACYAGEVFVRRAHAKWQDRDVRSDDQSAVSAVVVELGDGRQRDQFGAVFKRMKDGAPAGAHRLYLDCAKP